ncbi:MAG: HEAT repeat domain-containing protein [Pedosphaera sp.]|nr:HEAT repeat domain-containing protein [Pedosphaera sp.]
MVSLKRVVPIASAWSLFTVLQPAGLGQNSLSVSKPEADNSVKAELASFAVDKRLQVNLFADESMGIANPVCMRWDARGRLWVLCTWAYPQLKPGAKPNDKLLILEDTNGDAKADKIFTYIDGLNMPTGFALGHGGAYIGNGRELLHVRDTTGDGKADKRVVLFSGFGTGDTHQTINSFAWSPGGELFFSQGLHCFSRVQTPWGIRKLDEHGSWRLRPLRRQLHAHRRTSGGGNPWGFAFGDWGEPFIKSNGPGVSELLPGMVASEQIVGGYWGGAVQIGATKIKSMIIEIVDTPVLPKDFQGDFLIAGYFARNIARLRPTVNGAGHKLQTLAPILTSTHNAFRPVDLNTGPDGALYVADWFNPIIGHYQASLRHPDRDKKHGRIWRITTKGQPLLKPPALAKMNAAQLCNQLPAPLRRTRKLAKLRLMDLPKAKAIAATQQWVDALKPTDPALEAKLFEAIGVFESHEVVDRPLLERLLASKDYRARAYATRVVGRWHDRLKNPLALLRRSATDEHSRVRLEAIVAASDVREAESIVIAAQAADGSADRFITFAFKNAVHALASEWKPALLAGKLDFAKPAHLLSVVREGGGNEVASVVRQKLADSALSTARKLVLAELLAQIGNSADAALALELASIHPTVLHALVNAARERNLQAPANAAELLNVPLKTTATRAGAVQLIGAWKLNAHAETIRALATGQTEPLAVRMAAAVALGQLNIPQAVETLASLVTVNGAADLRVAALGSLAKHDVARAAQLTAGLSGQVKPDELGPVLAALLQRNAGADAMAGALGQAEVSADTAKLILRWLNAAGRVEPKLNLVLNKLIGVQSVAPVYSADFVRALAKEALAKGDAVSGKKVFQLPLASCTACHAVDGVRGAVTSVKGPNLSAVAAGLPVDLLVESVLWPARQIKEGYAATTVITKDGRVLSGFTHSEDKTVLRVRDLATGKIAPVQTSNIKQRTLNGTVMPPGLTASLTRAELRDLIKYLSTLKTTGELK